MTCWGWKGNGGAEGGCGEGEALILILEGLRGGESEGEEKEMLRYESVGEELRVAASG